MPTVLDAGSSQFSNADVLQWVRDKRAQHKQEDAEDKAAGRKKAVRPERFMESLKNHESELSSKKLPYSANPGAYKGQNRDTAVRRFVEKHDEGVIYPIAEKYRGQYSDIKELRKVVSDEVENKALTQLEVMMIANLAPENANLLQNLIDRSDTRFSDDQQAKIVQNIKEVFRCGAELPPA